jgi:serine/threonine-protein kinase
MEQIAHYELLERLGAGGMGTVYHARDTINGEEMAVKLLHSHLIEPDYASRLEREARIAVELDHPNIVRVNEYGVVGGQHYLAMELVDGESLLQRLRREGTLPPEEARRIAAEVAQALEAASAHGIVHRDIKPGNILIDKTGTVKVTDFGVAKVWGVSTITPAAGFLGTVSYAAPEVWDGRVDVRSDLYSLGVVIYHMVTGHLPFEADTPYSTLRKHQVETPNLREISALDKDLARVVSILLKKKPSQRFQSAAELLDALGGRISRRFVLSPSRLVAASAAGCLLSIALVLGIVLARSSHDAGSVGSPARDEGTAGGGAPQSTRVSTQQHAQVVGPTLVTRPSPTAPALTSVPEPMLFGVPSPTAPTPTSVPEPMLVGEPSPAAPAPTPVSTPPPSATPVRPTPTSNPSANPTARWSAPVNVSNSGGGSLQPNFVVDDSGGAHVLWTEGGDIYYSAVENGVPSASLNISNTAGNSFSQSIAVDGSGTLHAIWTDQTEGDGDPYYATKPASGSWSALPVNIYPTWLFSPETYIAAETNGDLHVIWSQAMGAAGDIYYCYKPASVSSWAGTCGDLDEGNWGWPSTSNAEIAVDTNGTVHLVQRYELNQGDNLGVAYRSKPKGGSWSGLQIISDSSSSALEPAIAVDSSGAAYAVWVDDRGGNGEIYYATNKGGAWSTPANISHTSGDSYEPRIVVDSIGTVHAVWEEGSASSREIEYVSKPRAGSWSGLTNVSNTSGDSIWPSIAVDGSSNVYVMWGDNTPGNYEIYYAKRGAAK